AAPATKGPVRPARGPDNARCAGAVLQGVRAGPRLGGCRTAQMDGDGRRHAPTRHPTCMVPAAAAVQGGDGRTVTAPTLALLLIAVVAVCVSPRRWVPVPFLVLACYIPEA